MIEGARATSWAGWLEWLARPQDGPVAVLLAIVVVCGLLGLRVRRGRGA